MSKITLYCNTCGKEMILNKSRPKKTCSTKCFHQLLSFGKQGILNPRFDNGWRQYHKYKPNLLNCERCGCDSKLEVHHMDTNKKNNNFSNLIRVCRFCHMELDGRFINLNFQDSGTGLCAPRGEVLCQK